MRERILRERGGWNRAREEEIMMDKNFNDFLQNADWDGAIAALPDGDKDSQGNALTSKDYTDCAYVRCFQAAKAHNDGGYDDVIADASKALVKDRNDNRALCIRAYGYYLNNNYDDAITDCEKVIERADADADIKTKKQAIKDAWKDACAKMAVAEDAKKKAEKTKDSTDVAEATKAEQEADTAVKAAETKQTEYYAALCHVVFAHELLGIIYSDMGKHPEASKHYKLALLARQTPLVPASPSSASQTPPNPASPSSASQTNIVSASPLLMDAYRNARRAVKGI
jgi:tetratricopeptide (TPR) repeat protein